MRNYCGTPRETIPLFVMDLFVDLYATLFFKNRTRPGNPALPGRVLIASLGHLGDALTLTYLFPLIRSKYPDIKIDLLAPSWCAAVNQHNPYVDRVITLDHYYTNRKNISLWAKLKEHYRTFRQALPVLREESYDYYFDIRYSNAVAHYVLPFISVNKTYGFSRRGLGGLLDKEFDVPASEFHHFDMIFALFREMGIEATLNDLKPYFHVAPDILPENIKNRIALPDGPFLMLFPESGGEHKQLSPAFWALILDDILEKTNLNVLLCGQTRLSEQIIHSVRSPYGNRLADTSGKISIHEIALLSERAVASLTLDSFPGHLCCVFCKTIALYKGTGYPFFPLANFPFYLIHNHQPSLGLPFDRKDVEIAYQENLETQETKNLIINRLIAINAT